MEKIEVIKYLELMNKYEISTRGNERIIFSPEDMEIIKKGNEFSKTNGDFNKLKSMSLEQRTEYINNFYDEQNKTNEEEQAIKEEYGFDITNIENKHLHNGVEIFKFYAPKLGRTVVLENRKDKSLTEQLKEKQALNEQFQSVDEKANTNNMLEQDRLNNDIELNMIPISEVNHYGEIVSNMSQDDLKVLNYIIKNAEALKVKTINLKNLVFLDSYDQIREVVYNKEKDIIEDQNPNTLEYNEEKINTSEKVDTNLSDNEKVNNLANDYEDKPEEKTEIEDYDQLDEDTKKQLQTYIDYPDLLNSLDEEEKKKWQHYIELYEAKQKEIDKPKVMKKEAKPQNGEVNIILLSIVSLVATLLMMLIAFQSYK